MCGKDERCDMRIKHICTCRIFMKGLSQKDQSWLVINFLGVTVHIFLLHSLIPSIFAKCISKRVLQPWVSLTETDNAQMAACCCLFPPLVHLFDILTPLLAFCHMFSLNFVLLLLLLPFSVWPSHLQQVYFLSTDPPWMGAQFARLPKQAWVKNLVCKLFFAEQCTKLSQHVVCSLLQLEVWSLVGGSCTILTAQLVLATQAVTKIIQGIALRRSIKISSYYVFVSWFSMHLKSVPFLCSILMCFVQISSPFKHFWLKLTYVTLYRAEHDFISQVNLSDWCGWVG